MHYADYKTILSPQNGVNIGTADFDGACEGLFEYFEDGFPARMTSTTDFRHDEIVCQTTGLACKPQGKETA